MWMEIQTNVLEFNEVKENKMVVIEKEAPQQVDFIKILRDYFSVEIYKKIFGIIF